MNHALHATGLATQRSSLKIHRPVIDQPSSVMWLINGFPARVVIWTPEEWAILDVRPLDAQPFPNGIWCALRID